MISSDSYLCGIFGFPIHHSASPAMHNAAFKHLKINGCYGAFEVFPENLKKAVEAVRVLGLTGVNVTIPYKEKVLPYLDELSPEAKLIGAVNTIHHVDGRLVGFNTDGRGFQMGLEEGWGGALKGKRMTLVGAGGAARAAAVQAGLAGVRKLMIVNRDQSRLKKLTAYFKKIFPKIEILGFALKDAFRIKEIYDSDCIINATSLGMEAKDPLPMLLEGVNPKTYVYDLVYRPLQTRFVKEAIRKGCRASGGLNMLLYQGALAFQIWTGKKAPLEVMKRALENNLK